MRKVFGILIVTASLFVTSCNKEKAIVFDINYASEVDVPKTDTAPPIPLDFTTPDVPTESSQKFTANGTARDLVSEIKFTKFSLSVNAGNLDHISSFKVFMNATGLSEVQIAQKDNIPAGSTSVNADVMDVNIKEYIFKDNIKFRIQITFAGPIATDHKMKIEETLQVKATLLK